MVQGMRSVRHNLHNVRMNQVTDEVDPRIQPPASIHDVEVSGPVIDALRQVASHSAFIARVCRENGDPGAAKLIAAERARVITKAGMATHVDDRGDRWCLWHGRRVAHLGYEPESESSDVGLARPWAAATGWRSRLRRCLRLTAWRRSMLSESHRNNR